jgi:hypothetical protein
MVQKCHRESVRPPHDFGGFFIPYFKGRLTSCTNAHLVDYSGFTALGQPGTAIFSKTGGGAVTTTYTYIPETGRLRKLETTGMTISSTLPNNITHDYTYDNLSRLAQNKGSGVECGQNLLGTKSQNRSSMFHGMGIKRGKLGMMGGKSELMVKTSMALLGLMIIGCASAYKPASKRR